MRRPPMGWCGSTRSPCDCRTVAFDVVIRPEAILLTDRDGAGTLSGIVATATYMGSHAEYNLDTPVGRLFAVAPEARRLRAPGEQVGIRLADHGVFAVRP